MQLLQNKDKKLDKAQRLSCALNLPMNCNPLNYTKTKGGNFSLLQPKSLVLEPKHSLWKKRWQKKVHSSPMMQ